MSDTDTLIAAGRALADAVEHNEWCLYSTRGPHERMNDRERTSIRSHKRLLDAVNAYRAAEKAMEERK